MNHLLMAAFLAISLLVSSAYSGEKPESSHSSVTSPGGFIAHSLRFSSDDGAPEGRVFIEKDGQVIATLEGVTAVSFSPTADILLVCEDIADHDLKHYFLNIGAGEFKKSDPRSDYIFGSPWVTKAIWSGDGRFVVLFDQPGITEEPPAVIKVEDFITKTG